MTTLENDQLETGKPEPRRDNYNRAMLLDPNGNRVPYTRVSTIAKALDDKDSLINYNQRLTAVGLTRRKDIHDIIQLMTDPEGDDKSELRRLVNDAADAGGAGVKANQGTARHKASERIDAGESPTSFVMPDDIRWDIDAYLTELDRVGLRPLPQLCETHGVIEGFDYNGLGVSGTFDKALGDGSDIFCADMKTGQQVKYAMLAWSIQVAMYANFEARYDVRTDTRHPMPDLRKDVGFIIWLPAGQRRCKIIEIDLANGFRYAQLAAQIRGARAHGKVDMGRDGSLVRIYEPVYQSALPLIEAQAIAQLDPILAAPVAVPSTPEPQPVSTQPLLSLVPSDGPVEAAPPPAPDFARRDWLKQRLRDMPDEGRQLVAQWWTEWNSRADKPIMPLMDETVVHTTWELTSIETWVNEAESHCQHDLSADPTVVAAKAIIKHFPGTIDEGSPLSEDQLTALSANLGLWCQPSWLPLLQEWREEAIRLGRDFGIKECPTTRRLALYELGANLCNICEGQTKNIDLAWAVLATAKGWTELPEIPFGFAFSMLTQEDISTCLEVATQTPFLALCYENGCPTWAPVDSNTPTNH